MRHQLVFRKWASPAHPLVKSARVSNQGAPTRVISGKLSIHRYAKYYAIFTLDKQVKVPEPVDQRRHVLFGIGHGSQWIGNLVTAGQSVGNV